MVVYNSEFNNSYSLLPTDRAVENAKLANRQASTKIPSLGPNLFQNRKSWRLFKEDRLVHNTIVLEDQLLWSIIFCNATEALDWYM